jgi:hypothetical protein
VAGKFVLLNRAPSMLSMGRLSPDRHGTDGRRRAGVGTVEKHVRSIVAQLCLPNTDDDHRHVLAVLTFLETRWLDRSGGRRRGW